MGDPALDPHVERALQTFNDHEIDAHMTEFAEGATFRDPVLDEPVTGDDHREYLRDVITSWRDYWDQQTFREQLGLTFPAVLGQVPKFVAWALRGRR